MKAAILAGDFGTRLNEATNLVPKPMVEIDGKPIPWHVMKTYSHYGISGLVIYCGYKQYIIREYFASYFRHNSDMTVDLSSNATTILGNHSEDWEVTMVGTGLNTQTGGRIRRVQKYLGDKHFLLTYDDGVTDLNTGDTLKAHESSGYLLPLTAYKPDGKFSALQFDLDMDKVLSFQERPDDDRSWVNTGYFVCEPEMFDYIPEGDPTIFERQLLESIAKVGRMRASRHMGFWKPTDTLRGNTELNEMWDQGVVPWKVW